LLDQVPVPRIRAAEKLLVGFSDVTALHAAWARAGVRSIHGPMVAALGRAEPATVARYVAILEGGTPAPFTGLDVLAPGIAEGPLVGGNLAVLAALVGTPFAPPLEGAVLFLEDVGERPYRIDRMLTTLRHAGWLARVSAVVLGAFADAMPGPDGVAVAQVLGERLSGLGVPVLSGVPAGHIDDNAELPLGARVRVDAARAELTFLEPAARCS
jgi:muramoyltetrapeptide carboxypeptidase